MALWAKRDPVTGRLSNFHSKASGANDEVSVQSIPDVPAPWEYDETTKNWKRGRLTQVETTHALQHDACLIHALALRMSSTWEQLPSDQREWAHAAIDAAADRVSKALDPKAIDPCG